MLPDEREWTEGLGDPTLVAKPQKTKGKLPISRHPLFAPMVALWFAALFGLGSLAIRPALLESAVLALRLDLVVPAAAPPLGFTFRILLALSLFVVGGAIGFILARRIGRPAAPQGEGFRFSRVKARAQAPAPVVAEDYQDDDDFARLDSARQVQEEAAAAANAHPGRRRALAMEEDFSTEFHDFAPLPGHKPQTLEPQILDLAELGSFDEELPAAAKEAPATAFVEAQDEEPKFDPWNRHPASAASSVVQEFVAEAPAPEAAPLADFSRPQPERQEFGAPAFAAPADIAPPAAFDAPPSRSFDAPGQAEPVSFDPPAQVLETIVHPVTELHDPANDEVGVASDAPAFAAPVDVEVVDFSSPTADFSAPEAEFAAAPAEQVACNADAGANRPIFGTVTGDAAEQLVAMPLTSLGVVQLAERLALAIARKRENGAAEIAQAPALPADLAPPQPPVPVAFPVPPSLTPPAPLDFVAPAPVQIFAGYESEMDAESGADEKAEVDEPAAEVTPLFAAPSALPAALRPISFDEPEDEEQLPSILPPRTFPKLAEPVVPQAEEPHIPQSFAPPAAEAEDDGEEENYASLLDLNSQSRPFVRIEEPEVGNAEIEPVVIFPGQDNRLFGAPAGVAPGDSAGAARLFDTPPSSAAPLRMPPAATRSIDAEETERQLKAALATLQRMSGAA